MRTWKTKRSCVYQTNSAPEPCEELWIFKLPDISLLTLLMFVHVFLFFFPALDQQVAVISTIAGVISSPPYVSTKAGYENEVVAKVAVIVVPGVGAGNMAWMNACSLKWTRCMAWPQMVEISGKKVKQNSLEQQLVFFSLFWGGMLFFFGGESGHGCLSPRRYLIGTFSQVTVTGTNNQLFLKSYHSRTHKTRTCIKVMKVYLITYHTHTTYHIGVIHRTDIHIFITHTHMNDPQKCPYCRCFHMPLWGIYPENPWFRPSYPKDEHPTLWDSTRRCRTWLRWDGPRSTAAEDQNSETSGADIDEGFFLVDLFWLGSVWVEDMLVLMYLFIQDLLLFCVFGILFFSFFFHRFLFS